MPHYLIFKAANGVQFTRELNDNVLQMIVDSLDIGYEGCEQNEENSDADLNEIESLAVTLRAFLPAQG